MRSVRIVMLIFLLIFVIGSLLILLPDQGCARTYTVDQGGSGDFRTISEAVDSGSEGDTVYVHKGVYHESFEISTRLTLEGEDRETTVIDGLVDGVLSTVVVKVSAEEVTIKGFTVRNSGYGSSYKNGSGIETWRYTTIEDCYFTEHYYGVHAKGGYNRVANCSFENNLFSGIRLCSNYLIVENCSISQGGGGIRSGYQDWYSGHLLVQDSVFQNLSGAIFMDRAREENIFRNCVFRDISGTAIEMDGALFDYERSKNNVIEDCLFENCGNGAIDLELIAKSTISNNRMTNVSRGIYFRASYENTANSNEIQASDYAMRFYWGHFNHINTVKADDNIIENNRFYGCSFQISSFTNNNKQKRIEGNQVNDRPLYYYDEAEGITVPTDAGNVVIYQASGLTLEGLQLEPVSYGIFIRSLEDSTIKDCVFKGNTDAGIWSESLKDNIISDNSFEDCGYGIYACGEDNEFTDNSFRSNGQGIRLAAANSVLKGNQFTGDGLYIFEDTLEIQNTHDIDLSNTVNGRPLVYLKDQTAPVVSSGAGQLILVNCSDVSISGANCSNTVEGATLLFCSGIRLDDCSFYDNGECAVNIHRSDDIRMADCHMMNSMGSGVKIKESSQVEFNDCRITGNNYDGIEVRDLDTLTMNTTECSGNLVGIDLQSSSSIQIKDCDFENNKGLALDLRDSIGVTLEECVISGSGGQGLDITFSGYGISVFGTDFFNMTNCRFTDNEITDIRSQSSDWLRLKENKFEKGLLFNRNSEQEETLEGHLVVNNTVKGNPLYYYVGTSGLTVPADAGQIILVDCSDILVEDQNCSDICQGLTVYYSDNIVVANSSFDNNGAHGIAYFHSQSVSLTRVSASRNLEDGLYLWESGGGTINTVSESTFSYNLDCGVDADDIYRFNFTECVISGNSRDGLRVDDSDLVTIDNCSIQDNHGEGIYFYRNDDPVVRNNGITNNGYAGIRLRAKGASISKNTISGNEVGIFVRFYESSKPSYGEITNNSIQDNRLFGINALDNDDSEVFAGWNWWGHESGPYHETENPGGKGDNVTSFLDFGNWLSEPAGYFRPEGVIEEPVSGSWLLGAELRFQGSARVLGSVVRYVWTSSIHGEIYNGTEPDFETTALSRGEHTITLRVLDDFDSWSEASTITLVILKKPVAVIRSVTPSIATISDSIVLQGAGEADAIITLYVWHSSIDGEIYNGSENQTSFSNLSAGNHTISLRVRDDNGVWSEKTTATLELKQKKADEVKDDDDNGDDSPAFTLPVLLIAMVSLAVLARKRKAS